MQSEKKFYPYSNMLPQKVRCGMNTRGTIALVYDDIEHKKSFTDKGFSDASFAEWESMQTINSLIDTWRQIGFDVIPMPIDVAFFDTWLGVFRQCCLVHSVAEGLGSVSREGWIPSLCEFAGIPYIGSSPFTMNLCMSKWHTKLVCQKLDIPTAPSRLVQSLQDLLDMERDFPQGAFLKPNSEGSGLGIDADFSFARTTSEFMIKGKRLLEQYPDGGVLFESILTGPEYTSGFIGFPERILPIAQIEVETGVYGLKNKGKDAMTEVVTFPQLPTSIEDTIQQGTRRLIDFLGLKDFARIDWKCNDQGEVFLLEINPLAGLSLHYSVLPLMAEAVGIGYAELLGILADSALRRCLDAQQGVRFRYGQICFNHSPTTEPVQPSGC